MISDKMTGNRRINNQISAKGYRDLIVWQRGINLVKNIYPLTQRFPSEEKYGLISQMRRSAVSIPSNIAEGQAPQSTKEFIQFISIAEGSLAELDTQLTVSIELNYCRNNEVQEIFELIDELKRMLNSLRRQLTIKVGKSDVKKKY